MSLSPHSPMSNDARTHRQCIHSTTCLVGGHKNRSPCKNAIGIKIYPRGTKKSAHLARIKREKWGKHIITLAFDCVSLFLSFLLFLFFQLAFFFFSAANRYHSTRSISFPFVCPTNSFFFFYCFSSPYSPFYTFGPLLLCCDFCRDAHIFLSHQIPFTMMTTRQETTKTKTF